MMKKIGIEIKLITFISLLLFISMGTLIITSRQRLEILVKDQMNELNRLVLTSLQNTIPYLLEENELSDIQRLIENTGASKAIAELKVFSPESVILSSSSHAELNRPVENDLVRRIVKDKKLVAQGSQNDLALPVHGKEYNPHSGTDIQAILYIKAESPYFLRTFASLQNTITGTAVVMAAVLILATLLFLRVTLKNPLKKLMFAITEVEKGNYHPEVSIKNPWEIREFTNMFLKMLHRIEEQNMELSGYSNKLEKMVESRTRELDSSLHKLKEAQNTIIQQEKMASIGQLAAGVAHEINNPAGFVIGNLSVLEEYLTSIKLYYSDSRRLLENYHLDSSDELRQSVEKLETTLREEEVEMIFEDIVPLMEELNRGTARIKDIVHGLKNFARMDNSDFKRSDINMGIEEALKIGWNKLKYKAHVTKSYGDLPMIFCNLQQLEQVFINLLTNAADAIESDGIIKIETSSDSENVYITIEDNGRGIPEGDLKKVFDPFFTTKAAGSGTGLGLSISHGIIQKHNGKLSVSSTPGKGTAFSISLPLHRSDY